MLKGRKLLSILLALSLVVALGALAGCGGQEEPAPEPVTEEPVAPDYTLVKDGVLTVGSDLDFSPMERLAADGTTPEGFTIDLMNAIGEEMNLAIEYLPPQEFATLLASVNAGKFDVVASSLTISDVRKQEVTFSDPYFDSNQSIAMRAGETYSGPEDLKDKQVGVQSGTTGEAWANENLKPAGAKIVPFKKTSEAFGALEAGNVDGVVNDLPITTDIVAQKAGKLVIVSEIPTGEQYGLAVAKDNAALATALSEALKVVVDSGEYQSIYDRWFVAE